MSEALRTRILDLVEQQFQLELSRADHYSCGLCIDSEIEDIRIKIDAAKLALFGAKK